MQLTDEQKVKTKFPYAECIYFKEGASCFWGVISTVGGHTLSATHETEETAWADAARRLEGK